jgi:hypothetical protein
MSLVRVLVIIAAIAAVECFQVIGGYPHHPHRHHHEAPRSGVTRNKHTKRQTNENQQKNLIVHVDGREGSQMTEQWIVSVAENGEISLVQEQDCPTCKYTCTLVNSLIVGHAFHGDNVRLHRYSDAAVYKKRAKLCLAFLVAVASVDTVKPWKKGDSEFKSRHPCRKLHFSLSAFAPLTADR